MHKGCSFAFISCFAEFLFSSVHSIYRIIRLTLVDVSRIYILFRYHFIFISFFAGSVTIFHPFFSSLGLARKNGIKEENEQPLVIPHEVDG